ncbi:MAG: hypothetical protein HYV09_33845 [Deltaproteobacteria bacterium]|nr:hypothetical protein [Deltaproteobacteria bacterium]
MTKRVLGVLAALAMVSGLVACSSSSSGGTTPTDGGKTDAATDAPKPVDGAKPETAVDTGPNENGTTGIKCTSDDDCDKGGDIQSVCTENAFSGNSLNPTPVCIAVECDIGDGTKIMGCDKNTGVCLSTGSGGICFPVCEFADSADAPKGCEGNNKCNLYGWGKDDAGKTIGVGYCFGGCKADADCPTGNKCQVEDGLCMKTVVTYTKTPGTACTDLDAKAPAKCNCLYTTADKAGYCANTCWFGETTCAAGFTCDAGLPKTAIREGDTVFTAVPKGMAGYCLKDCTTDADCAGLNAYCDENAGTGKKTCQIGKRPCTKNEQCPSPQTCVGATADSYGRCG